MAAPTRTARRSSIANRRAAATASNGRKRLPPPIAAWRMASNSRSRLSPGGRSKCANIASTARETRRDSRSMATPGRASMSIDIEGLRAVRTAVRAKRDLLDAHLRRLEPRLAVPLQLVPTLVELDRFIERRAALLERAHDGFELSQSLLEAHLLDGVSVHRPSLSLWGAIGKRAG